MIRRMVDALERIAGALEEANMMKKPETLLTTPAAPAAVKAEEKKAEPKEKRTGTPLDDAGVKPMGAPES